jgi:hypothetical protein
MRARLKKCVVCLAALVLMLTNPAANAAGPSHKPPKVSFDADGVTIGEVEPGDRVAWISVELENPVGMSKFTVRKGLDAGNAGRAVAVKSKNANRALAVWLIAQIDGDGIGWVSPPQYQPSAHRVAITAAAGAPSIGVRAAAIELMYVRPGGGAWTFRADDGSALDGDRVQNGTVVVALQSLEAFRGNAAPPASVQGGDAILVVDRQRMKVGQLEVQP